jgi:tetratricopeptide (TPR) repeat protein
VSDSLKKEPHESFLQRGDEGRRLYRCWARRPWLVALTLFVFALSWRLVYLHQVAAHSPFFDTPVVDAQTYFQQAEQLATKFTLGDEPFWQPPLYPIFLGGLHLFFGAHFYAYRLVQFTLGGLSVALLYLIGRRVFSHHIALMAGAVTAVYGPLIYFEGELLPPVLAIFLNLSLLLFLLQNKTLRRGWSCLVAGLLLGLAGLAVPSVLPFGLWLGGWIFWCRDLGVFSVRLGRVFLFALGVLAIVGSATLRNYYVGQDLVVLSWNSGLNFYIGNNPDYPQTVTIRPGTAWYNLMQRPKEAGFEKHSEQSAYFWREALSFVKQQPGAYLGILAKKMGFFWQGGEIRRNTDIYFARSYSPLLSALVWKNGLAFPFGLIAPFALLGLLLAMKDRRLRVLAAFLLIYIGSVVAFFVTARYRLPAVPLLILFACFAGSWIKERLLKRQWRVAVPVGGFLFLVGWGLNAGAVTLTDDAQEQFYLGLAYARKDMVARAVIELNKVLELDPDHYDGRFKLAELSIQLGNVAQAKEHYRYLIEQNPPDTASRRNLANLHLQEGSIEAALALFREIISLEPEAARSYFGLAGAHRVDGNFTEAETAYKKALALNPDHFDARYSLAFLYDQKGSKKEAQQEYERLLERNPGHDDIRNNLGVVFLKQRDFAAAAVEFEYILSSKPNDGRALRNVALAYEGLGRQRDAVQQYERLVQRGEEDQVHNHLARLYRKLGDSERAQEELKKHRGLLRSKEIFGVAREQAKRIFEGGL